LIGVPALQRSPDGVELVSQPMDRIAHALLGWFGNPRRVMIVIENV
jgi:hypothetical protein